MESSKLFEKTQVVPMFDYLNLFDQSLNQRLLKVKGFVQNILQLQLVLDDSSSSIL